MIRLLTRKNFKLLFQRARTKVCEVDLVFEKDGSIFLIEVKTLSSDFAAFERIGKKQMSRLKANSVFLSRSYTLCGFRTFVAFVQPDQKISFANID